MVITSLTIYLAFYHGVRALNLKAEHQVSNRTNTTSNQDDETQECALCLELMDSAEDKIVRLFGTNGVPCPHAFHHKCAIESGHTLYTCPLCRAPRLDGKMPVPPNDTSRIGNHGIMRNRGIAFTILRTFDYFALVAILLWFVIGTGTCLTTNSKNNKKPSNLLFQFFVVYGRCRMRHRACNV